MGISFLSLICPCMFLLKKKNMQRKIKSKRSKMLLNMIASVYSMRCGSYKMYLEGDSPHHAVMIVCELKRFSHISNRHSMYTLIQFCDIFHTQIRNILCYSWYMCRYNVIWPSQVLHVLMYAH